MGGLVTGVDVIFKNGIMYSADMWNDELDELKVLLFEQSGKRRAPVVYFEIRDVSGDTCTINLSDISMVAETSNPFEEEITEYDE